MPARCELRDPSIDTLLPNWSPDACRIVFSQHAPGGDVANIAILDADGNGFRQLTTSSDVVSVGAAFAPDGRRIVFARPAGKGTRDLFTLSRQAITSHG